MAFFSPTSALNSQPSSGSRCRSAHSGRSLARSGTGGTPAQPAAEHKTPSKQTGMRSRTTVGDPEGDIETSLLVFRGLDCTVRPRASGPRGLTPQWFEVAVQTGLLAQQIRQISIQQPAQRTALRPPQLFIQLLPGVRVRVCCQFERVPKPATDRGHLPFARPALLAEHPADVVVAFHPLPVCALCAALKQSRTPLVAVGTDLVVMHAFYVAPGVRRYLVATELARAQLLRHGVDPARIEVTGLPVRRPFAQVVHEDPQALREQLGLDAARPLILVMGGGVGFGPLEQVARAVAGARLPAQIVVLTGSNERLRERLEQRPLPPTARVQGFTPDVHLWMRAADILLTKAGPNSIAEALAVGTPTVLWGAIPVQETPNVEWVVRAGAALWAPGPRRATAAAARLLEDRQKRDSMRQQARLLSRPEAAEQAAAALWRIAQGRED